MTPDYGTDDVPTMRVKAIGDMHVVSLNIKTGATLEVGGVEVI